MKRRTLHVLGSAKVRRRGVPGRQAKLLLALLAATMPLILFLTSRLAFAGARYPRAADDAVTLAEDSGPNPVDVLANDLTRQNAPLTIVGVTQGANGSAAIAPSAKTIIYSPISDYFGEDSFTYTISDGRRTDTATVSVTVTSVNDPPIAVNDVAAGQRASAVTIHVLANDTTGPDPGEQLTIVAAGAPQSGGGKSLHRP